MLDVHCHTCGGRPANPWRVSYRLPPPEGPKAPPRRGDCTCAMPIVYGAPAGYASSPGMARSEVRRRP